MTLLLAAILIRTIALSLAVSFVLTTWAKMGALDLYEAYRPKFFPSGGCFFCLGFWLSWILGAGAWLLDPVKIWILVPFLSAPLINFITLYPRK